MDLVPFSAMLEKRCGLVFEKGKRAILESGIRARMKTLSVSSPLRYFSLVLAEPGEFACLVDQLTINETYFYRDSVHFDLLAGRVVPEIFASKGSSAEIRILSAGCSSGEEAYSILIALAERYGRKVLKGISVTGIDIDTDAVSAAGEGIFGKRSFRGFPEDLLEKYFEPCSFGNFRVRQWLRDSVEFLPLNLLNGEFPSRLRDADVIFYRNVSIYLSREARDSVFTRLAGLLTGGGHLFVSPSETFFHDREILSLITMDGCFCYRKDFSEVMKKTGTTARAANLARFYPKKTGEPVVGAVRCLFGRSRGGGRSDALVLPAADEPLPALVEHIRRLAERGDYDEALVGLEEMLADFPLFTEAYLLKGNILLNLSRLEEAGLSFGAALEMDGFNIDAVFSLGMIARLRREADEVIRRFREVVYLRPSCWPAHFFLGEAYRETGEKTRARREYAVILGILRKGEFFNHGLASLPLAFSAEQMETLCRGRLALVKEDPRGL